MQKTATSLSRWGIDITKGVNSFGVLCFSTFSSENRHNSLDTERKLPHDKVRLSLSLDGSLVC